MKHLRVVFAALTLLIGSSAFAWIYEAKPTFQRAGIAPVVGEIVIPGSYAPGGGRAQDLYRMKVLFRVITSYQGDSQGRPVPFPEGATELVYFDGDLRIPFEQIQSFQGYPDPSNKDTGGRGVFTLVDGKTIETRTANIRLGLRVCREGGTLVNGGCIGAMPTGTIVAPGLVKENARYTGDVRSLAFTRDPAAVARAERELQAVQEAAGLSSWRDTLREGSETNCGMVVQTRGAIVEVQLKTGLRWMRRDALFQPHTGKRCDA